MSLYIYCFTVLLSLPIFTVSVFAQSRNVGRMMEETDTVKHEATNYEKLYRHMLASPVLFNTSKMPYTTNLLQNMIALYEVYPIS